nr:ATP-dependent helicase HrpB [uncultured bacterium]
MVRRVQSEVRPDLKAVVMSATLAAEPIARFLGNCPIVESQGRLYPVEISYLAHEPDVPLHHLAADTVAEVLDQTTGDVLVFLPGVGEIRRTADELTGLADRHNLALMQLYGDLPLDEQQRVLRKADRRKVVLATNVAETSVTIDGVTAVVDTGLARVARFDPGLGLNRLEIERISRSSADQRAGRAGRTAPGVCRRLWTERQQRGLAERDTPEVLRVDLAGPVLELLCWGEADVKAFPWFERPPEVAIDQAMHLLRELGAMNDAGVTETGRLMARLPVQPRIARLLVEGHGLGHVERAALLAATLSERDPFRREPRAPRGVRPRQGSDSDVLDRVAALEDFARSGHRDSAAGQLDAGAAKFVLRSQDQLRRLIEVETGRAPAASVSADKAVLRAVLAAFPDRVARRRDPSSRRAVMVGGRGVRLADESAVTRPELFVCVELAEIGQAESLVRQASGIERDWLPAELVQTSIDVEFDPARERVVAVRRTRLEDLVLEESPINLPPGYDAAALLAREAAQRLDRALMLDPDDEAYLARVRCLREWMPELGLPDFGNDTLRELLPQLCAGCTSFDELRKAPILWAIKHRLTQEQLRAVEREAPERLQVPSGNAIRLQYEPGKPPVLAVRIQEIFGWTDTPRVAGGRVSLLLHLLAPNMRPQQVTNDLRSFWANTYAEVRKDLRRRYPKHAWPEDPSMGVAEKRPRRKP